MHIPLVTDPNDYRWQLLKEILNIFDLMRTRRIIARFSPVKTTINCIKIILTSMFFSTTVTHVVEELKRRKELRDFIGVSVIRTSQVLPLQIRFRQLCNDDFKNSELDNEEKAEKH